MLINKNGILVGQDAKPDVGGLIATTLDASDTALSDQYSATCLLSSEEFSLGRHEYAKAYQSGSALGDIEIAPEWFLQLNSSLS